MKKKKLAFLSILGILIVGSITAASYFIIISSTKISSFSFTLKDNEGNIIWPLAMSDKGEYIVAGNWHTRLYLFKNLESEPSWIFTANEDITSVDITPDGNYIVAGGTVNDLYLLDRSSPNPIWTRELDDRVISVQISSDGKIIAASTSYKAYVFESDKVNPLINYTVYMSYLGGKLSADGTHFVTRENDWDGNEIIYFFNTSSSLPLWNFTIEKTGSLPPAIISLAISSKGNYIAVGNQLDYFYLFDKSININKTPIWSFHHPYGRANSVSFSEDENLMVVGFQDGVYLFNPAHSTPLWNYSTDDRVNSVVISKNGKYIVADCGRFSHEGEFDYIYLFESNNSTPIWKYDPNKAIAIYQISSDNKYIIALIGDLAQKKIFFFDRDNPKIDDNFHIKLNLAYIFMGVSIGADIFFGAGYLIHRLRRKRKAENLS